MSHHQSSIQSCDTKKNNLLIQALYKNRVIPVIISACIALIVLSFIGRDVSVTKITKQLLASINDRYVLLYWFPAIGSYVILLGQVLLSLVLKSKIKINEFWLILNVFITIFLFRWPWLSVGEQLMDEGFIVAIARTLLVDPVYWKSVDGGTHGPLVALPLVIANLLFGFKIEIGLAKAIGLFQLVSCVVFLYWSLKNLLSVKTAKLCILPVITFLALQTYYDFLAYNGEMPVIFLLSFSLLLASFLNKVTNAKHFTLMFVIGLVLGSVCFTKIQGLPLAFTIGLLAGGLSIKRYGFSKDALLSWMLLLSGFLAVFFLVICYVIYHQITVDFLMRYLIGQFAYGNRSGMSFGSKLDFFYRFWDPISKHSNDYFSSTIEFVKNTYAFVFILYVMYKLFGQRQWFTLFKKTWLMNPIFSIFSFSQDERSIAKATTNIIVLALFFLLFLYSAFFSIILPGNILNDFIFIHYFLFLLIPLILLPIPLFELIKVRFKNEYLFIICGFVFTFYSGAIQFNNSDVFKKNSSFFKNPGLSNSSRTDALSRKIAKYTEPNDRLVTWGFTARYHNENDLILGTRTTWFSPVLGFGNYDYYVKSIIKEMNQSRPDVFLDILTPPSSPIGVKVIPGLYEFINNHYVLVGQYSQRSLYFLRNRYCKNKTDLKFDFSQNRNKTWSQDGTYKGKIKIKPADDSAYYGSWSGSDSNIGILESMPFLVEERLIIELQVTHGPSMKHQRLGLKIVNATPKEFIELRLEPPHHSWKKHTINLSNYKGREVVFFAEDNGKEWGQWLGFSEPVFKSLECPDELFK
jgi:hypothetical protein